MTDSSGFRRFHLLGLILLAGVAGYFVGMPDPQDRASHEESIRYLEDERDRLKGRNEDLENTLKLVRLQIETDRIAYDNLQLEVEASKKERLRILELIREQRELLNSLKKNIQEN